MRKLFFSILSFLVLIPIVNAQRLSPRSHDFGKVKLWNNPTATFVFRNNTNKRIIFLPIRYQRNLQLAVPEGFIEPGESVEIIARYYTEKLGSFSISQDLFVNIQGEPIPIKMKGKIISFHPNALTACPIIDKSPADKKSEKNTTSSLTVYDHKSGLTINEYDVIMNSKQERYVLEKAKNPMVPLGQIPLGLYEVKVSKEGYYTETRLVYINRNTPPITFELEPVDGVVRKNSKPVPKLKSKDVFLRVETEREAEMADIEKIRKIMNEKYKGRKIIEKDVLVINEDDEKTDSIPEMDPKEAALPIDQQSDITASGTLNSFKYRNNNVVFLIDVSASMANKEKLEMLKVSMKNLVDVLRHDDLVTIVTYSSRAKVILSSIPGNEKDAIKQVIDSLKAMGRSYGAEGMNLAYQYAEDNFIQGGNNQIILATDGLFNSKDYTDRDLYRLASDKSDKNINTSVIGFGKDKKAELFMSKLARNGNGNFMHVLNYSEANSALISEIQTNSKID